MSARSRQALRIATLVLLTGDAAALAAHALFLFSGITDLLDWSVAILTAPLLAGLVGVARRRRWGRTLSAVALAAQMVLFSMHLRNMWGHLHGGEVFLLAWILYAAIVLGVLLLGLSGRGDFAPGDVRARPDQG